MFKEIIARSRTQHDAIWMGEDLEGRDAGHAKTPFDFLFVPEVVAIFTLLKRQMKPVCIQLLKVPVKGVLPVIFTDPDDLKDEVSLHVNLLHEERLDPLVEKAAWR